MAAERQVGRDPTLRILILLALVGAGLVSYYALADLGARRDATLALERARTYTVGPNGKRLGELVAEAHLVPESAVRWQVTRTPARGEPTRVSALVTRGTETIEYRFDVEEGTQGLHPANPRARELLEGEPAP